MLVAVSAVVVNVEGLKICSRKSYSLGGGGLKNCGVSRVKTKLEILIVYIAYELKSSFGR